MNIKVYFLLIIGLTIYRQGFSQIDFRENVISDESYGLLYPEDAIIVDLDSDGDMDVLVASAEDRIVWFENKDGDENFNTPYQIISENADGPNSVHAVDIDGDNDLDVLSSSQWDDKIAWYENIDGLGHFSVEKVISTNAEGARFVFSEDIDGDGDIDVLSASYNDNKIAWYENIDGRGTFGAERIIDSSADGAEVVHAVDIDGDGDIDVLSASDNNKEVAWYENINGLGDFSLKTLISTISINVETVYSGDLDGDGDMDVVSTTTNLNKIAWYENIDGQGDFGSAQVVDSNLYDVTDVFIKDIDGDGDMDIVAGSNSFESKIAWYENIDGNGTFSSLKIINLSAGPSKSVSVVDVDGDGDNDVISTSYSKANIVWFENIDGLGNFGVPRGVGPSTNGANTIRAVDIDSDGDDDILSVSAWDDKIAWYENIDGQGNFGLQNVITYNADFVASVYVADIDGDGDVDLLSASRGDDKIAWYENTDGMGLFGSEQIISLNADYAQRVYAMDLDGDGDIDVLSASLFDDKIAWYKNIDGEGTFSNEQIISTSINGATSVFVEDLDGDGDMDVLSGSYSGEIVWYENIDGLGVFGVEQVINISSPEQVKSIYSADVDGDGDKDVIYSSYEENQATVAWHENLDGGGSFGPQLVISSGYVLSLYAVDLDIDGDLDVVSAFADNKLAWYENMDGQGGFSGEQLISSNIQRGESVYASDLDNDGDVDVLSASSIDDKIAWHENLTIDDITDPDEGEDEVEADIDKLLILSPNPINDVLTIVSPNEKVLSIVVFDGSSRVARNKRFTLDDEDYLIDLSDLESALYFITIITENDTLRKRIIKK